MKLRLVVIILLLSFLIFFGFKKVSANKNNEQSTNIEKLAISSSDCSLTSIKTGSSLSELNQSLRLEAFIDFG